MADRERVRRAIDGPVDAAAKSLRELSGADTEARLMAVIDGWGRGLAAGLEELALAVDELRRIVLQETSEDRRPEAAEVERAAPGDASAARDEQDQNPDRPGVTEEDLRARARESREATKALREEAQPEDQDAG